MSKSIRKLVAIMFADIVSYSRMMGEDESETLQLLQDYENNATPIIHSYGGIVLKKIGDNLFCEFSSALNAVECALQIQEYLYEYNQSRPKNFKLLVRIGSHVGDVVKRDNDLFGDGVNVAARIQPLAPPGGICISGAVFSALQGHQGLQIVSLGERELKNIIQKRSIYQVKTGHEIQTDSSTSSLITPPTKEELEKIPKLPPEYHQITFVGDASYPAISPNGKYIAYVSNQKVMIQELTGGQPLEVFSADYYANLRWSPDGSELMFNADSNSRTFLVSRLGGTPRSIMVCFIHCWSPDGSQIASIWSNSKQIWFTNKSTGDITSIPLSGSFTWLRELDWSPAGNLILFETECEEEHRYTIWTITTDGSQEHKVFEDNLQLLSPCWSPKGDAIYYLRNKGETKELCKIPIVASTGESKASAAVVLRGLQAGDNFSLSMDGKRLLYTRELTYSNLWLLTIETSQWGIFTGKKQMLETKQLTKGTSTNSNANISPDGKRIAFTIGNSPKSNIFTIPIEGGSIKQITFLNSYNTNPVWSPDGKKIAFGSTQGGTPKVWIVDVYSGMTRQFAHSELSGDNFSLSWAPNSNILYQRPGNRNFHILNIDTEEERPLVEDDSVGLMFSPRYSPDGKKVVVERHRINSPGLWVISLEDSSQTFLYKGWCDSIGWSADGKWIYVMRKIDKGDKIEIIKIFATSGETKTILTLPFEKFVWVESMTSDGKQFVCEVSETQSDVWLIENFDPEVK